MGEEGVSFSLIKIEGKPLEKLIEVVSNAIGTIYRPIAIRKEADAKGYEIKVIEKAKAEALAQTQMIELKTLDRIERKILSKERQRINNIDNIVGYAAQYLNEQSDVSDESVHPDWSSSFFDRAQDISDEKMQKIWGNLLAQEIINPGGYSLRAIETLSKLTKEEALIFSNAVNSSFLFENNVYIVSSDLKTDSSYVISPYDLMILDEIGITRDKVLSLSFHDETIYKLKYGSAEIRLIFKNDRGIILEGALCFTTVGLQLSKLVSLNPDLDSILSYIKFLTNHRADYLSTANRKVILAHRIREDDILDVFCWLE